MIQTSIKTNSRILRQACVDFVQSLLYDNVATEDFDVSSIDAAFLKEVVKQAMKSKKQ